MKSFFIILISFSCTLIAQIKPAIPDFLISGDDNNPSSLTQNAPVLTQLNNNNFLVTWSDMRDGSSIYSQRFDKNGNKINKNFKLDGDRAFLEKDGSMLALKTNYSYWFDDTYYQTYAKVFNPELNLLENTLIYDGILPWCGTGYITGEDLVAGSDENFFYLSNEGGVLRLVKLTNDGSTKAYDHVENLQYITQTALAASENSTLLYAWLKGGIGYYYPDFVEIGDSLSTGIYVSFLSSKDSVTVPALLIKELNQTELWEYVNNFDLGAIALNDSLFKLFWIKKDQLKLYSVLINSSGKLAGSIDSLVITDEISEWSIVDINLTNKDETCFYVNLRSRLNADAKEYLIRYDLTGHYTGEIHSREFQYPYFHSNLFNAGDGIFYSTWSDGQDVFLLKYNYLDSISSVLINDDGYGSEERNYSIKAYGENSVFASWDDEKNHYGAKVNADGTFGNKILLNYKDIMFFKNEQALAVWVKQSGQKYNAGYTIFDRDLNELSDRILASSLNRESLSIIAEVISDTTFIILLDDGNGLKLIKEGISGSTLKTVQTGFASGLYEKRIFNDAGFIWVQSFTDFKKYSYDLGQLDKFSLDNYSIISYIGNDKFMIHTYRYTYPVSTISGTIINPNLDTLYSDIPLDVVGNNWGEYRVERLPNNRFIVISKQGNSFHARTYNNNGVAFRYGFIINTMDNKTSSMRVMQNGDKVYFTWSEARTPGRSYDIYCTIYDADEITSITQPKSELPTSYKLEQNYPNPFNPETNFEFQISSASAGEFVTLKIYDILGNEISTLVNEEKPAGVYTIKFDASTLASGVYYYTLRSGSFTETKKMVVLK